MSALLPWLEQLLDGAPVAWLPLGQVAEIGTGSSNRQDEHNDGSYPFYVRSKNILRSPHFEFDETAIIIPGEGGIGDIFHYVQGKYALHQRAYRICVTAKNLNAKFLYYFMHAYFRQYILTKSVGATSTSIRKPMLEQFEVPIPCPENREKSLVIQGEIVRVLDKFSELNKEYSLRKKQYNFYRDKLLTFPQDKVDWKTLGEVTTSISAGGDLPEKYLKGQTEPTEEFPYPIYSNGIDGKSLYGYTDGYRIDTEAVTISARGTIGWHTIRKPTFTPIVRLIVLIPNTQIVTAKFLDYILDVTEIGHSGGSIPQLTVPNVKKIKIPVPPLAEQTRIVAMLDKFETLTNSISEGLPREIELRQKQYQYYRNLLLDFPQAG